MLGSSVFLFPREVSQKFLTFSFNFVVRTHSHRLACGPPPCVGESSFLEYLGYFAPDATFVYVEEGQWGRNSHYGLCLANGKAAQFTRALRIRLLRIDHLGLGGVA